MADSSHLWSGLLATLGLWLPGVYAARALRCPHAGLSGAALAAIGWFHLVLVFDLAQVPLRASTLLPAWGAISLGGIAWWWWRRRRDETVVTTDPPIPWPGSPSDWLWLAAAVLGLGSIALRGWIDPLSGWDSDFRWHALAQTVFEQQTLAFYPATTAADFELLAWIDGIPPLVSLLNFWFHLWAGVPEASATSFRTLSEGLLLMSAVGALARRWGGAEAHWPALALWSTSALAIWSTAMGQETGLTALALTGLVLLLPERGRPPAWGAVVAAAAFAALGGLSREYGLAFGLLGIGALLARRRCRREIGLFLGVWAGSVAVWYLRTWIFTGNPFHPMGLMSLFPRPPAYHAMAEAIDSLWNWRLIAAHWTTLALTTLAIAGALVLVGAFALIRSPGQRTIALAGILMMLGLWIWSVPQTAGGVIYSLRVLSPALALLAGAGGVWLANLPPLAARLGAGLVILAAFDGAKRSWLLPTNALASPFAPTRAIWKAQRDLELAPHHDPAWAFLNHSYPDALMLTDNPSTLVSLRRAGCRSAMLFSPTASDCFSPGITAEDGLAKLRAQGVGFLLLSVGDPIADDLHARSAALSRMVQTTAPNFQIGGTAVFDLTAPIAIQPPPQS